MQKFFRAFEILLKALLMVGITLGSATSLYAATQTFNYSGAIEYWTVPANVTIM